MVSVAESEKVKEEERTFCEAFYNGSGTRLMCLLACVAGATGGVAAVILASYARHFVEPGERLLAEVYLSNCGNHSACGWFPSDAQCCPDANGKFLECCRAIPSSTRLDTILGIGYTPNPMKTTFEMPSDDFMGAWAQPYWGEINKNGSGRDDLATMRALGANAVRTYGNAANVDKRQFLDRAYELGLGVFLSMSNYPYTQDLRFKCAMDLPYDCYSVIHTQYSQMLLNGLTILRPDGKRQYHPSIKVIGLSNEPELVFRFHGLATNELRSKGYYTKALLSAFDAVLDAERGMRIVPDEHGKLPPFTVTYSYDNCEKHDQGKCICAQAGNAVNGLSVGVMNAVPFMYDLVLGLLKPSLFGYQEKGPRIGGMPPLKYGLQNRLALSYNTQVGAQLSCDHIYRVLAASPLKDIPLFVGEFHATWWSAEEFRHEVNMMKSYIQGRLSCHGLRGPDGRGPVQGLFMFEFQKSYFKPADQGAQSEFGIFELGTKSLGNTAEAEITDWNSYPVWCLRPKGGRNGFPEKLRSVYGGSSVPSFDGCPRDPIDGPADRDDPPRDILA